VTRQREPFTEEAVPIASVRSEPPARVTRPNQLVNASFTIGPYGRRMETCPICGMALIYLYDTRAERASEYSWFCVGEPSHVFPDRREQRPRSSS